MLCQTKCKQGPIRRFSEEDRRGKLAGLFRSRNPGQLSALYSRYNQQVVNRTLSQLYIATRWRNNVNQAGQTPDADCPAPTIACPSLGLYRCLVGSPRVYRKCIYETPPHAALEFRHARAGKRRGDARGKGIDRNSPQVTILQAFRRSLKHSRC